MITIETPSVDLSDIPQEQQLLATTILRQISNLVSQINQANYSIEASDVYVSGDQTLADILSSTE